MNMGVLNVLLTYILGILSILSQILDNDKHSLDPTLNDPFAIYDEFPTSIHKFRHRRDRITGYRVSRGRFEYLNKRTG